MIFSNFQTRSCDVCFEIASELKQDPIASILLCPPCYESIFESDSTTSCYNTAHKINSASSMSDNQNKATEVKSENSVRFCVYCGTTSAIKWYKTADKAGYLCRKCYDKKRREEARSGNSGRMCGNCSTIVTSRWRVKPDKSAYLCERCDNKERRKKLSSEKSLS